MPDDVNAAVPAQSSAPNIEQLAARVWRLLRDELRRERVRARPLEHGTRR